MKRKFLVLGLFISPLLAPAVHAADCTGEWKVIPHYKPGKGGPCKLFGLDTHAGVCKPGNEFETLCDDASGGRYRICSGIKRCNTPNKPILPPPGANDSQNGFKEGYRDGYNNGFDTGYEYGYKSCLDDKFSWKRKRPDYSRGKRPDQHRKGYNEGYDKGFDESYSNGFDKGYKDCIIKYGYRKGR